MAIYSNEKLYHIITKYDKIYSAIQYSNNRKCTVYLQPNSLCCAMFWGTHIEQRLHIFKDDNLNSSQIFLPAKCVKEKVKYFVQILMVQSWSLSCLDCHVVISPNVQPNRKPKWWNTFVHYLAFISNGFLFQKFFQSLWQFQLKKFGGLGLILSRIGVEKGILAIFISSLLKKKSWPNKTTVNKPTMVDPKPHSTKTLDFRSSHPISLKWCCCCPFSEGLAFILL